MPAADAASFALESFSSYSELLVKAGGDTFEKARRALTARYAELERGGSVRADGSVHIVLGEAV
jgi:hypothetical protein